jgi:hypothetical protein
MPLGAADLNFVSPYIFWIPIHFLSLALLICDAFLPVFQAAKFV